MVSFSSLLFAVSAMSAALAAPSNALAERATVITSSQTGTSNGYFFSFWTDGGSQKYSNTGVGKYTVTWTGDSGNFVAGVGWSTGSARAITYSGTWAPVDNGNSFLSVYGWTTSPLVEYYILEAKGQYDPSKGATYKGEVTSDGGTYKIYESVRTNAPSIQGTSTFNQYWSVRTSNRVGGTVTTANHFAAWKKLGLDMGTFDYQVLATEGYNSAGTASIAIS